MEGFRKTGARPFEPSPRLELQPVSEQLAEVSLSASFTKQFFQAIRAREAAEVNLREAEEHLIRTNEELARVRLELRATMARIDMLLLECHHEQKEQAGKAEESYSISDEFSQRSEGIGGIVE